MMSRFAIDYKGRRDVIITDQETGSSVFLELFPDDANVDDTPIDWEKMIEKHNYDENETVGQFCIRTGLSYLQAIKARRNKP